MATACDFDLAVAGSADGGDVTSKVVGSGGWRISGSDGAAGGGGGADGADER